MSALVRGFDWSNTPLGPIAAWPLSLRTTVGIVLHSRQPMFLWWGPELVQIYNDAYRPSLGTGKHPTALGQRARDCWQEAWPIIGPEIDDVMAHARPSRHEDELVPIYRNGRIEEVHWTYGYSPVFDDDGAVGGTLVVCIETTASVVAGRRRRILREVTERTLPVTELGGAAPAGGRGPRGPCCRSPVPRVLRGRPGIARDHEAGARSTSTSAPHRRSRRWFARTSMTCRRTSWSASSPAACGSRAGRGPSRRPRCSSPPIARGR